MDGCDLILVELFIILSSSLMFPSGSDEYHEISSISSKTVFKTETNNLVCRNVKNGWKKWFLLICKKTTYKVSICTYTKYSAQIFTKKMQTINGTFCLLKSYSECLLQWIAGCSQIFVIQCQNFKNKMDSFYTKLCYFVYSTFEVC